MSEKKFIPVSEPSILEDELKNVTDAIKSGWISSKGQYINEFEESFSSFIGTKYGVSTSNGTTALHLALSALHIGEGDKVIVPDLTFISPVNTILYNHATPVLIDATYSYWSLDPEKIEEKIDGKTKAIIVVHLYGHPADMEPIVKLSKKYDLKIIEDCAEAHGAQYRGRNIGTFGDISCYSFYGNKIITTGEGGMCLTNNSELESEMIMLRDHGMNPANRYWHDKIGYNYRMTNLQAAIGVAQVGRLSKLIEKRRLLASHYREGLRDLEGLVLHPEMSWAKNVYWLYSVLVENNKKNLDRDTISKLLIDYGIDNRRFFYPVHFMPPYRSLAQKQHFPISERLAETGLNLPSSYNLEREDVNFICEGIREIMS